MFREKYFPIRTVLTMVIVLVSLVSTGCKKHEHPAEHPEGIAKEIAITKDELADAVEAYVKKESAAHGGYFIAFDEKAGQELKLILDKVHRKRLSRVGENLYFACADFKTPTGKIYDLDVFMKGATKENLVFSEFSIHKEAGKERYTWYEQAGIWKKKPVGQVVPAAEHPKEPNEEHPKEPDKERPREHPSEHPK